MKNKTVLITGASRGIGAAAAREFAQLGAKVMLAARTETDIKTIADEINKNGGQVVNNGSLDFMFTRKSVIEFEKTEGLDLEELELNLIDFGLEEMDVQDDRVIVYGEFTSFGELTKACEDMGITGAKATLQRIANNPVEFTEAQIDEIEVLIDKLEEDDDVQSVFTNIA